MTKPSNIFMMKILLFICRVVSDDVQVESSYGQKFLRTLQDNIKLHEKCKERRNTQENTMFKITGKRLELEALCQMIDSLRFNIDPNEMLTIITIRDIKLTSIYCPGIYMQNFISGLQEYIRQDEFRGLQNSLSINVNCAKKSHAKEFDRINTNLEIIYKLRQKISRYIVNHFHDICLDALKEIMVEQIYCRFYDNHNLFRGSGISDKVTINNMCHGDCKKIFESLQASKSKIDFCKDLRYSFVAKESTAVALYMKTCEHERNIGVEHFSYNFADFMEYYEYILKKEFVTIFEDGVADLLTMYFPIFEMEDCRQSFSKYYTAICNEPNTLFRDYNEPLFSSYSHDVQKFCRKQSFTSKIQSFFEAIQSDDIRNKHNKMYKEKINSLRQKTTQENVTKIVFNGRIDNEKMHQLCDLLLCHNCFDEPYRYQSIYIDFNKGMTEVEALACAAKCDELGFECLRTQKTLEFSAMIKPMSNELIPIPFECFKYRRTACETKNESTQASTNMICESDETKITICEFSEAEFSEAEFSNYNIITSLMSVCTSNNNSKPVDTSVIMIKNKHASSFIIFFLHSCDKTKKEIISLIYDMPYTYPTFSHENSYGDKRYIRCLDNVPVPLLGKLKSSLQNAQFLGSVQYKNPNLAFLSTHDLVHIEVIKRSITTEKYNEKYDYRSRYFYNQLKHEMCCRHFSAQEIVEFECTGKYKSKELINFVESLQISQTEFNQILTKFILNNGSNDLVGIDQNIGCEFDANYQFYCFLYKSKCGDDSMILHLSETRDSHYTLNVKNSPIRNLSRILEFANKMTGIQQIDCALESFDSNMSFSTLVLSDVCMRTKYLVKNNGKVLYRMETEECLRIIYKQIEKSMSFLCNKNKESTSSLKLKMTEQQKLQDIQKSINPNEIERLAEIIVTELYDWPRKIKTKTTHVKLRKRKNDTHLEAMSGELQDICEQYDNLETFGKILRYYC